MRHRTADEAEVDSVGALEADGLDGGRDSALHLREVGGERHVAAPLPYLEFPGERTRSAAEVGAGDDVEHDLRGGGYRLYERAERLQPPPDAEVERQVAAR